MKFTTIVLILLVSLIACTEAEPTPLADPSSYSVVSGARASPLSAAGVTVTINDVEIREATSEGLAPAEGYMFVILNVTVENNSSYSFAPILHVVLVDRFSNQYATWYEFFERPMLVEVKSGESGNGSLVYQIPAAALSEELRFRWESSFHEARIEIMLGDLAAELESESP